VESESVSFTDPDKGRHEVVWAKSSGATTKLVDWETVEMDRTNLATNAWWFLAQFA
jgi:hypothetical protein